MNRNLESVRGIIIGEVTFAGALCYDERPQSKQLVGANDAELREQAKALKARLIAENPGVYPGDLWTLRLYD